MSYIWENKETGEKFTNEEGDFSICYDEHTDKTQFWLGDSNILLFEISGDLEEYEIAEYIEESAWEISMAEE